MTLISHVNKLCYKLVQTKVCCSFFFATKPSLICTIIINTCGFWLDYIYRVLLGDLEKRYWALGISGRFCCLRGDFRFPWRLWAAGDSLALGGLAVGSLIVLGLLYFDSFLVTGFGSFGSAFCSNVSCRFLSCCFLYSVPILLWTSYSCCEFLQTCLTFSSCSNETRRVQQIQNT